ncbi:protein phosphatase 1 regulatory subunit 3G [Trichomycterus rosablanca]|uniref:protein phosphatase 1 regulatory subunit 3G n=1 Tax=Trichomycterus rosablanca TaxID=2290929 RepID=UPI002F35DFF3
MSKWAHTGGELQNGKCCEDEEDSDTEEEEDEVKEMYLRDRRRAKSLPAYPEQARLLNQLSQQSRKQVKFADALGLSLFSVKHFSISEEPQIPIKAFPDMRANFKPTQPVQRLVPACETRLSEEDTCARLNRCQVALERVSVSRWDVRGMVRVTPGNNEGTEVKVRYTFNDWASFADADAHAVPAHEENRFAFTVHAPPVLAPGAMVHFAVYMRNERGEFWDNNDGQNYSVRCGHSV